MNNSSIVETEKSSESSFRLEFSGMWIFLVVLTIFFAFMALFAKMAFESEDVQRGGTRNRNNIPNAEGVPMLVLQPPSPAASSLDIRNTSSRDNEAALIGSATDKTPKPKN